MSQPFKSGHRRRPSDPPNIEDFEAFEINLEEIVLSPPRPRRASDVGTRPSISAHPSLDPKPAEQGRGTPPSSRRHSDTSLIKDFQAQHHASLDQQGGVGSAMRHAEASITGFMAPLAIVRKGFLKKVNHTEQGADDSGDLWFVLQEGALKVFNSSSTAGGGKPGDTEAELPMEQVKRVGYVKATSSFCVWFLFEDKPGIKLSQRFLGDDQVARFGSLLEFSFEAPSAVEAAGWVRDLSSVSKGLSVQMSATKAAQKGVDGITALSGKVLSSWKSFRAKPT